MTAGASMTFRVDADLQSAFMAACKASDVTAAQVLRSAMRDFLASSEQPSLPLAEPASKRVKRPAARKGSGNG